MKNKEFDLLSASEKFNYLYYKSPKSISDKELFEFRTLLSSLSYIKKSNVRFKKFAKVYCLTTTTVAGVSLLANFVTGGKYEGLQTLFTNCLGFSLGSVSYYGIISLINKSKVTSTLKRFGLTNAEFKELVVSGRVMTLVSEYKQRRKIQLFEQHSPFETDDTCDSVDEDYVNIKVGNLSDDEIARLESDPEFMKKLEELEADPDYQKRKQATYEKLLPIIKKLDEENAKRRGSKSNPFDESKNNNDNDTEPNI